VDRAGRARLLALCWIGVVLVFFSFSTTQEYYSMPCYPALALLLGSAMAAGGLWVRRGLRIATFLAAAGAVTVAALLFLVRGVATPGDISAALTQNTDVYTLSLGHMMDLTLGAFAYLRLPLVMAGVALVAGAIGSLSAKRQRAYMWLAVMMALFAHAARLALVEFDPYLSSRPLAEALKKAPRGTLIVDDQYYAFSSVFFYTNQRALLLNGRVNNLEYGSNAPGAPEVFIDDGRFGELWRSPQRRYLVADGTALPRLDRLVGRSSLHVLSGSGGKFLFSNEPRLLQ
jgi:hypothetical protein